MRLFIKVHPKSKKVLVLKKNKAHYEVWVKEAPENGKANQAVLELIGETLSIPKSHLDLISGARSKNKVIAVL